MEKNHKIFQNLNHLSTAEIINWRRQECDDINNRTFKKCGDDPIVYERLS